MGLQRYFVYFTPLENADMNEYGDEIDVSDRVEAGGITNISKTIDSDDYDIGVFVFSDLTIKCYNFNGYFNDEGDVRSIFKTTRDRCKVRVVFENVDVVRDPETGTVLSSTVTDTITFRGLINEEATKLDVVSETISFRVLSRDSVLRNTQISAGSVDAGQLTSAVILQILSVPKITAVLNIDAGNINPALDIAVDDGTPFDNKNVSEMINQILVVTNSVMLINDDGDVIVKNRNEDTTKDIVGLYGKSDEQGRENIIDINDYNTGRHRMFTSVVVNGVEAQNADFAEAYGYRQKRVTIDWITTNEKAEQIAEALVEEFKFPKTELKVKVPGSVARSIELFDRISVNYPLRVKPIDGTFLPVIGATQIGDDAMPLPDTFGSIAILPRVMFKVISISEDPSDFTATLKLRQVGNSYDDGFLDSPDVAIVGFAVIGVSVIAGTGDTDDTWNPSVIGAALIGSTEVA